MKGNKQVFSTTVFLLAIVLGLFAAVPVLAAPAPETPPDDVLEELGDVEGARPSGPVKRLTPREAMIEDILMRRAKTKSELPPIKMVLVKGGCFEMGDLTGDGDEDERPVHEVCLSNYLISETEVTRELFEKVTGRSVVGKGDPTKPMTNASAMMVHHFLKRLNELTKGGYRLPTEAEWEYAARERGKKMRWAGTDNEDDLADYAWFDFNSEGTLQKAKQKKPNALGLYDMSGNAAELCEDFFDFDYYKRSSRRDPLNDMTAKWRAVRGGSFINDPNRTRNAFRYPHDARLKSSAIGFRLAQ